MDPEPGGFSCLPVPRQAIPRRPKQAMLNFKIEKVQATGCPGASNPVATEQKGVSPTSAYTSGRGRKEQRRPGPRGCDAIGGTIPSRPKPPKYTTQSAAGRCNGRLAIAILPG